MRQRYESEQDKKNELSVIKRYLSQFDNSEIIYQKLSDFYQLDYALYWEGHMREIVEIKCRNNFYGKYDTLILSAHKLHELVRWGVRGIRPILLAQFTNGLYEYQPDVTSFQLPIKPGGRTDRDDWQDSEPVYHIPIKLLRRLA